MQVVDAVLTALILLMAVLYSSVGHAGSSGYQAAMALCGTEPAIMRTAAQSLNVLVALITTVNFARAGHFRWSLWWPFALASAPMAYLASLYKVPAPTFKVLVGVTLFVAAGRLAWPGSSGEPRDVAARISRTSRLALQFAVGAAVGVLSGLTGTGGGIFFTPILLVLGWATPKEAAGATAPFILSTSTSALFGLMSAGTQLPPQLAWWMPAALVGGVIGSSWGSRRFGGTTLKRLLALVLVIAALKLVFNV
jgi:uncharacterized membrane protein YfcA